MNLFTGAIDCYKNAHSHRHVTIEPTDPSVNRRVSVFVPARISEAMSLAPMRLLANPR